jgi:hypothetical protein
MTEVAMHPVEPTADDVRYLEDLRARLVKRALINRRPLSARQPAASRSRA